ncbi:unnamed protein product [Caenorhabditis auriculariae]|uniref:Uncharacterized protein n=1 Tax=Caenorhabditis auriculariae TaxID=2777116 RepID=A0A8S1GZ80_9PELO|nr:unnamed protein product [Caenorhabditis auriculariae]
MLVMTFLLRRARFDFCQAEQDAKEIWREMAKVKTEEEKAELLKKFKQAKEVESVRKMVYQNIRDNWEYLSETEAEAHASALAAEHSRAVVRQNEAIKVINELHKQYYGTSDEAAKKRLEKRIIEADKAIDKASEAEQLAFDNFIKMERR